MSELTVHVTLDKSLNPLLHRLEAIERQLSALQQKVAPKQEWYTLKEACALKGLSYGSVGGNPKLQPNGGKEDGILSNRRRWRYQTILSWLSEVTP